MPLLGLGVFENDDCAPACTVALERGYRLHRPLSHPQPALREGNASRYMEGPPGCAESREAQDGRRVKLVCVCALPEHMRNFTRSSRCYCNSGVRHLEEIREAGLDTPAVNQIELHPFCQQRPIVDYCNEKGIVVQAYCPLVRGEFGNPVLQEVAQKYNKDVAQILVRWSLQHGFSPLPKSSHPPRVVSNSELYDFALADEDMAKIDALDKGREGAVSWNPVDAE
ncbi:hypothetical protein AcV7_005698 [Taiwanofungus camphoratus]|nr:hypothetical protein AcV7_005698 [Antrodia cinnamomea]